MTIHIKNLSRALILLALFAVPLAQAKLLLITGGEIQSLSNRSMEVGDLSFPLSPTVKVLTAKNKRMRLQDLKRGDTVKVEVHEVAGKRFIDRIFLIRSK